MANRCDFYSDEEYEYALQIEMEEYKEQLAYEEEFAKYCEEEYLNSLEDNKESFDEFDANSIVEGQILYVVLPNKIIKPTRVVDVVKTYEKDICPSRYLNIYTRYLDEIVGTVTFYPEDFGNIIFTSEENAKQSIK